MWETLLQWDNTLLLFINGHHATWADQLMWAISQPLTWIPFYVLLLLWLGWLYRHSSKVWLSFGIAVIGIAVAVGLSDYITSGILKPLVCRLRPSHSNIAPLLHLVNNYHGGKFGFPSSHAANCFAILTSVILLSNTKRITSISSNFKMPKWAISSLCLLLIFFALSNCYSRMYLGVHYPIDILCGAAIGTAIAWATMLITTKLLNRL